MSEIHALRNIPSVLIIQFSIQQVRQFDHGFIVLAQGITCLGRENGNAIIDTVMKGDIMSFETEIPINGIKIIFFVGLILTASGIVSPPIALLAGIAYGFTFAHPYHLDSRNL